MIQTIEKSNITPEQFVYWLQGFSEISDKCPTEEQWKIIKDHLQKVFEKRTPDYTYRGYTYQPLPTE